MTLELVHVSLERIYRGRHLTRQDSTALFEMLVQGEIDPVLISALLVAFKAKGEHPEEIAGAAGALRRSATPFPRPDYAYADTCGTGGDGSSTINISTATALVCAEMGIPIAKHGNRSVSSNCGSADVLERAGVNLEASPETARRCLDEVGICFMFAPQYHPGMRFAMPVRRALRTRTIFNLLGPLANPSAPRVQLMGVYDPALCEPLAQALGALGCDTALVVHGSGLDEVAIHGPTHGALLCDGEVELVEISPKEAGLPSFPLECIAGSDPGSNEQILRRLLSGQGDEAHNAAVAINAGTVAWLFGHSDDLKGGTQSALEAIASGRGIDRLRRWGELSHGA